MYYFQCFQVDGLITGGKPIGGGGYTAISRNVVGKIVHAAIPKGKMGYDQYTVPDTEADEPTFAPFLSTRKLSPWPPVPFF